MTDQERESRPDEAGPVEPELRERRNFLLSLGKWSKAVIGGVALGGLLTPDDAQAQGLGWANSRDGDRTWVNLGGGGSWGWGPGWYDGWSNRPWSNRGWHNRPWHNRGGWHNGGGSWYNRGGGWKNRGWKNRGGGDWHNRSWHNR